MNRGLNGFPTRDSVVTSVDPYAPLEDGGYAVVAESVRQGDLVCVNGTAEGAFPIEYGAVLPGGVADAAYGSATTVAGSLTGMKAVTFAGGVTGESVVGYSTSTSTYGPGAAIEAVSITRVRACVLTGGNYAAVVRGAGANFYPSGEVMRASDGVTVRVYESYASVTCTTVDCAALSNGNFVVAYGHSSGVLEFVIRGAAGASVKTATAISNPGGICYGVGVAGLVGGNFVVAYANDAAAPDDVRFTILDNAGTTVVVADTQIATGAALLSVAVASLSGGGFVVAWQDTGNDPHFRVYDSAGTAVSADTEIEAATMDATQDAIDVVGLNDGGFVVAYADSTNVKFARFNAAGTLQGSITSVEAVTADAVSVSVMPSGDFVVAYTNSTTSVKAAKFNPLGGVIDAPGVVEGVNSNTRGVAVACLQANINAIIYCNAATDLRQSRTSFSGTSSFQRYSSAGVAQGALTAVVANPTPASCATRLANGGFVYAYTTVNNIPVFTVWSRGGVVQVTETVAEAVYSRWISASALPNGEFALAWESLYDGLVRFGRYSAAGVLQGSLTTVEATTAVRGAVAGLRSGNFAVGYVNSAGTPRFAIFNAAGTPVAAPATLEAVTTAWIDAAGLSTGGVAFLYGPSSTSVKYITKTATGAAGIAATVVETVNNTAGGVGALPGGEFVVAYKNSTTNLRYAKYSAAGVLQGSLGTVEAKNIVAVSCGSLNNGALWIAYASLTDTDVRFTRYVSPAVVLGVADRAAAPGETVAVRTAGMFTLRDNWGTPQVFDHSTATPVRGNRGTIFGKTATLNGV